MTSVNESNAYQRGYKQGEFDEKMNCNFNAVDKFQEGLEEGRRQGEAIRLTKSEKAIKIVRWTDLLVAFAFGIIFSAIMFTTSDAFAQTAQTAVTVTISAEVPCNPLNCPEEPVQVINQPSWWEKIVEWISFN